MGILEKIDDFIKEKDLINEASEVSSEELKKIGKSMAKPKLFTIPGVKGGTLRLDYEVFANYIKPEIYSTIGRIYLQRTSTSLGYHWGTEVTITPKLLKMFPEKEINDYIKSKGGDEELKAMNEAMKKWIYEVGKYLQSLVNKTTLK